MNPVRIELTLFLFAIVLFLFATINPGKLIAVLGQGRVNPSQRALLVFRALAGFCVLGTIYRLLSLLKQ